MQSYVRPKGCGNTAQDTSARSKCVPHELSLWSHSIDLDLGAQGGSCKNCFCLSFKSMSFSCNCKQSRRNNCKCKSSSSESTKSKGGRIYASWCRKLLDQSHQQSALHLVSCLLSLFVSASMRDQQFMACRSRQCGHTAVGRQF